MAGLSYAVDFDGWRVPLGEARVRATNLHKALDDVGDVVEGIVRRNILDGGGPVQWPDLSEATLINRARYPQGPQKGGPRQVFRQRGRLMGPQTSREARIGGSLTKRARQVVEQAQPLLWTRQLLRTITHVVGADYVDTGSPLAKSWTLFLGSRPGKTPNVPARNPFGLYRHDEFSIMGILTRHIFGPLVRGLA